MNWVYIINGPVKKSLDRIPGKDTLIILEVIDKMQDGPYAGDVVKLGGTAWRKRAGNYRIKFYINQKLHQIEIFEIR